MSKRFTITVPDAIGQVIERMAEAEGSKPATTASYLVESWIKEGLQSGKYPAEWAALENSQSSDIDEVDLDSIAQALLKLKREKRLTSSEVALLEAILRKTPGDLAALAQNGNGEEANEPSRS